MLDVSGQVIGTTRLMAGGQPLVKTGGCVSLTCTAKLHVAPLPTPFVAEQLTVVVPTGKMLPEGGVHVTVGAGRPVEFTVKLTTAWHWPVVALMTTGLVGQVIVGATPMLIDTWAKESAQGGLEIVHRNTTGPAPPVC